MRYVHFPYEMTIKGASGCTLSTFSSEMCSKPTGRPFREPPSPRNESDSIGTSVDVDGVGASGDETAEEPAEAAAAAEAGFASAGLIDPPLRRMCRGTLLHTISTQ